LAAFALSFDTTNGAWAVSSKWELEPANPPVTLGCTIPFVDVASGGRAFVTIDIEGTTGEFLVDTGSEHTMIRRAHFDALVADGRPKKPLEIGTAYGKRMGEATTSNGVSPCGASRSIPIGTGIDDLLNGFDIPAGKTLAGIVGSSYLIEARTVIDYPRAQARIYRPHFARQRALELMHRERLGLTSAVLMARLRRFGSRWPAGALGREALSEPRLVVGVEDLERRSQVCGRPRQRLDPPLQAVDSEIVSIVSLRRNERPTP
jgi:hypothetical protein